LFGGQFIAPEQVRCQMASLEQQFAADFKEQAERRALIGQMNSYRVPILDLLSKDQHAGSRGGITQSPCSGARAGASAFEVQQVPEHIFTGSFGATVTPPDDYQWMGNAVVGNPDEDDETADNNTGAMFIGIWTDFNDHFRP
jgi:hypothetical protein